MVTMVPINYLCTDWYEHHIEQVIIIIIIIKQENDYSNVRQLLPLRGHCKKIKLKTHMLIVQKDSQVKLESNSSISSGA